MAPASQAPEEPIDRLVFPPGGESERAATGGPARRPTFFSQSLAGLESSPNQKTGAWAVATYLDQVVWADRCNDKRKLQLFTGLTMSDGDPSFARWQWTGSLEGDVKERADANATINSHSFLSRLDQAQRRSGNPCFLLLTAGTASLSLLVPAYTKI